MTRKQRRLTLIGLAGVVLAVAAGLVLYALSDRIVFFNSPSDVVAKPAAPGSRIRLGGLVETGSVVKGDDGSVAFRRHRRQRIGRRSPISGILPDLFREGQGVVAEGVIGADGVVHRRHRARQARRELHAEGGRRGAEGSKGAGRRAADTARRRPRAPANRPIANRRAGHMIAEARAFRALVLALACWRSVADRSDSPSRSAALLARCDRRADAPSAVAGPARDAVPARRPRLRRARPRLRRLGFLAPQRRREFALGEAAPLQGDRRLGEPRGLDAPLGADPRPVRRARRRLRPQPARAAEGAGPCRSRAGSRPPSSSSSSSPPTRSSGSIPAPARGQRPQPGAPGHRPRHPSAASLSRLCRLLDLLRLRRRRADRRPHRRRLGALGAAVDARRLDVPHRRHRDGLLLGLLRARLGRLLVLGPGRERLAHAVARRRRRSSIRRSSWRSATR